MKKLRTILSCFLVFALLFSNIVAVNAEEISTPANKTNELPADYVDNSNEELDNILGETNEDIATLKLGSSKKVDIAFVIDSTGSMAASIKNVKENIATFAKYLSDQGVQLRINVVEYKDITADGLDSTIVHKVDYSPWMNVENFKNTLTNITVSGGGDIPETPIDALGYLIDGSTMLWSSDAYKFSVVLTDAGYKVDNRHGYSSLSEIANKLAEKNINTSIITDTNYYSDYSELVSKTGGIKADIYSSNFSDVLQELADKVIGITSSAKKAIYILPGYMGSNLYDNSNNELWVNTDALIEDVKKQTLPFGEESIFIQSEEGTGSKVKVNMDLDKYGAQDTYKKLIEELKKNCGDKYDVVFFPYNWLEDLNDSAKMLSNDINDKGYDDIVFVTHSTGALLASTYISQSKENKLRVEKAILLAGPIFGTYSSLLPIEYGKTDDLDDMLADNGVKDWAGITYDLVYKWVKAVTKNSPTTYQLLPSDEYLKSVSAIWKGDKISADVKIVSSMSKYYSMLNNSKNINSNLTNGNTRSHKYLRDTQLNGDIVKVLQEVDTTLIASTSGYMTPTNVIYQENLLGKSNKIKEVTYTKSGDGTVLGISALAIRDISERSPFNYQNFPGLSHGQLVTDKNVLKSVCNLINGIILVDESSISLEDESEGMESMLKLNITSEVEVDIKIIDSQNNVVASIIQGVPTGFDSKNFEYTNLIDDEGKTDSSIYLPNSGYKVIFSSTKIDEKNANLNIEVFTLSHDGYKTSKAVYTDDNVKDNGEILILDMIDIVVNKSNIGSLIEGNEATSELYYTDWEIEKNKILNTIGEKYTINIFGTDVTEGNINNSSVYWSSSDSSIVSVSDDGIITANDYGEAYIYALAKDDSYKMVQCKVTVKLETGTISVDNIDMVVNEKLLINPKFDSDKVTETNIDYIYDESKGIISINEFGVVTALSKGSIEVEAIAQGGASTKFTVNVESNEVVSVQGITLNKTDVVVNVNKEYELQAIINPKDATNKNINWYISDESKLSIIKGDNDKCIVKGEKVGDVEVVAVTEDGGYIAKCKVKVIQDNVNTAPIIITSNKFSKIGEEFNPLDGVIAYDNEDGDITTSIKVVENNVNINAIGSYKVVYEVTDSDGAITTRDIIVFVEMKDKYSVESFVKSIYNVALNREPDEEGFNYWIEKLKSREFTGKYILFNLLSESEFKNLNFGAEDYVEKMYAVIVGREPDEEGFNYWVNMYNDYINNKGISIGETRISILDIMINEAEFAIRCNNMGIDY